MPTLTGKRCLVAGVGPGIGQAVARRLIADGARVVVAARSRDRLAEMRSAFAACSLDVAVVASDLATPDGASEAVETARRTLGGLDAAVLNTGAFRAGTILDTDLAAFDEMLNLNARAQFLTARAAAPLIAGAGGGAIVLVSAVYGGLIATRNLLAYGTAKAATVAMGLSLAADLRASNVRVNVVCPGTISHTCEPDAHPTEGRTLGTGPGRPEDVAGAIAFLISDEAFWISGATLPIDGGWAVGRDAW